MTARAKLFPVASFITGTTPNGGGIWKYILHKSPHGLLHRSIPIMFQALHFLDFKISPKSLNEFWRTKTIREHYNSTHNLAYQGILFSDSGGFTLMFNPHLNLETYNIIPDQLPEAIVDLQIDSGADFIASLDYPIPPGLAQSEAEKRMSATLNNALRSARHLLLRGINHSLYVPVHGTTPDHIYCFVQELLACFKSEGLIEALAGLAIGSMVPLRQAGRAGEILNFVRAVRSATNPELPIHVFGVTGSLIPFLIDSGATSFDSSGYAKYARNLRYIDPKTHSAGSYKALEAYTCTCSICSERNYKRDRAILRGDIPSEQKSQVYAAIALHNLETELKILDDANAAYAAGSMYEYIRELCYRVEAVDRILDTAHLVNQKSPRKSPMALTRPHTPDDYDLRTRDYNPEATKQICLIIPCAKEKPYTASRSFQFIWKKLQENLSHAELDAIEIVFLSGLYGPVAICDVEEDAVCTYDYLLRSSDKDGIKLVATRLKDFLIKKSSHFSIFIGYATLGAYRQAMKRASIGQHQLQLLPQKNLKGRNAFYASQSIDELIDLIREYVVVPSESTAPPVLARNPINSTEQRPE